MALEIIAAVVGIIAAAGKVAETLSPVVSTFVHAPNYLRSIHTEVRNTTTILLGIQALFEDLEACAQHRRELIQLPQLITALSDGVLLFSKLEEFVNRLGDPRATLSSRMQWARKEKKVESLLKRLLVFKNTMVLMMNILQCTSDNDAYRDRQELLCLTRTLLKDNSDMSKRIKSLEDRLVTHGSNLIRSGSAASSLTRKTNCSQRIPSGLDSSVVVSAPQPANHFDEDLRSSRPYRKARRHTADFSFRSSTRLSHAWTMISEANLSDISAVSVVGLPLYPEEVANSYHYGVWGSSGDARMSNIEQLNGPHAPTVISLPTPPPSPQSSTIVHQCDIASPSILSPRSPPRSPVRLNRRPTRKIQIVVKGTLGTESNDVFREFAGLSDLSDSDNILNSSHKRTFHVDGEPIQLETRIVNEIAGGDYTNLMDIHYTTGQAFILVYNTTSRESFDRIHHYGQMISQYVEEANFPTTVVGLKNNDALSIREVSTKRGKTVAGLNNCNFHEIYADDLVSVENIFAELVRTRWAYEQRVGEDKIMTMVREDRKKYLKVQSALTGRVSRLLKANAKNKTGRSQLRAGSPLSAIEES